MVKVIGLDEIKSKLNLPKIIQLQKEGFVISSRGKANIPMPGYIEYENPASSYHIKYAHMDQDKFWVVKIAGGPTHLPINGAILVFNALTGGLDYLLHDQGYLTSLRTAVAGLICAQVLATKNIKGIGIVGTGIQARMQLEILKDWTECRNVYALGRSALKLQTYKNDMEKKGFIVKIARNSSEIGDHCNLIITTTSSKKPLIASSDIFPGTHITAIGADSRDKTELDPALVARAELVVVDSKTQSLDHGEVCHAFQKKLIKNSSLIELGEIISDPSLGRKNDKQITIADLTGIAVQDMQIAKAIIEENNG